MQLGNRKSATCKKKGHNFTQFSSATKSSPLCQQHFMQLLLKPETKGHHAYLQNGMTLEGSQSVTLESMISGLSLTSQ
jgi:hypothetical protein